MSNAKLSKLQKAKNTNFKEAIKYAQAILADPKKKAEYALKIKRKKEQLFTTTLFQNI